MSRNCRKCVACKHPNCEWVEKCSDADAPVRFWCKQCAEQKGTEIQHQKKTNKIYKKEGCETSCKNGVFNMLKGTKRVLFLGVCGEGRGKGCF